MFKSIVALAALASTSSFAAAQGPFVPAWPLTSILPVPGWNSTTDGFNSLAVLYTDSAAKLSAQATVIAQTNVELSGNRSAEYVDYLQANLIKALAVVNNVFWQTAYETERKICAISTSINQQNVDTVRGNLRAGVYAEVQAVVSITVTITNTIAAVQTQITSFSDAERAVITTLIQAIITAATGSLGPIASLNAGLTSVGITALTDVVGSLQLAVTALQAAGTINWTIS